jgi:branched-chain amino acid aminotransferase
VFDGAVHTPPVSAALLNGITRNSLILWHASTASSVERDLPREYLYLCDELFMCGTAAEITPIRSVDGRQVGAASRAADASACRSCSSACSTARTPDKYGWLEPCNA